MRGITIDGHNTATEWGLLMTEKRVDPPAPKTNYLSVPGRDGALDYTEAVSGRVNYEQRSARFSFFLDGPLATRQATVNTIIGTVHGKRCTIQDTDDFAGYTISGRLAVSDPVHLMSHSTFTIEGILDPWRISTTEKTASRSGNGSISISNAGQTEVHPTITTTGRATISYRSKSYSITAAGTYSDLDMMIAVGSSSMTISNASGVTTTVKFREAVF